MSLSILTDRMRERGHDTRYPAAYAAARRATQAYDQLRAGREAVAKDGTLSEHGKAISRRKLVAEHIAAVEHARRDVARGKSELAARRAELRPKPAHKTSPADAMLHIVLGQRLGDISEAERAKLLLDPNADPRILAAAFELPHLVTGVSAQMRAQAEAAYIDRNYKPLVAQIEAERDAWEHAQAAVDGASDAARDTGSFAPAEFQQFVRDSVKPDAKDTAREAAQFDKLAAEGVMAQALKLPLSERIDVVGKLMNANTAEVTGKAA